MKQEKRMLMKRWIWLCITIISLLTLVESLSAADMVIYDDQLQNSWQDWSWGTYSLTETDPVYEGSYSISCGQTGWQAVYFHRDGGVSGQDYESLDFWIHGGTGGGQAVEVAFIFNDSTIATAVVSDYLPGGPVAGAWHQIQVDLAEIGLGSSSFEGVWFWIAETGTFPAVYLDLVELIENSGPVEPVTISISPGLNRRAINPHIYGAYLTDQFQAGQPPYPVRRWGGNHTTRYSWEDDVSNRASDWFYLNIANATDVPSLPFNSTADRFIDDVFLNNAEPLLTVPLIGWTPIDRQSRWGFSVSTYGEQEWNECSYTGYPSWCNEDAGNGNYPDGSPITGNDPFDTSRSITPVFVTDWMQHLAVQHGWANEGGLKFIALDNEPMLWNSTHRDVHPNPVDYSEMWSRTESYASAMKALDPNIMLFGPVLWGWCAYFYSAADGCSPGPDYNNYGPFLEWYLDQVESYRQSYGVRLVDYLDVHYYPQSGNVALSDDESEGTAVLRLRSTRSLYDASYIDESWINQAIRLIPRMREIIDNHAPGTKLAITEYNWGNDEGLTSALAQVEVLALFGREGVDLATRWVAPAPGTRVEDAFKLYLNYDGSGSQVQGDSVQTTSSDLNRVGAYAICAQDSTFYLVMINKTTLEQAIPISVAGGLDGDLSVYGFDQTASLEFIGSLTQTGGEFELTMPARSARLVVGQLDCILPDEVENFMLEANSSTIMTMTWNNCAGATSYMVFEDMSPQGAFDDITGTGTDGLTGIEIAIPGTNTFYKIAAINACGTGPK